MDNDSLLTLVSKLRQTGGESEWIEFKQNKADPDEICQYLSAISTG